MISVVVVIRRPYTATVAIACCGGKGFGGRSVTDVDGSFLMVVVPSILRHTTCDPVYCRVQLCRGVVCSVGCSLRSRTGVSGGRIGGTVHRAYRVYGGVSARTGDMFTASGGDKIVHAPSFMCVLNAYQSSY